MKLTSISVLILLIVSPAWAGLGVKMIPQSGVAALFTVPIVLSQEDVRGIGVEYYINKAYPFRWGLRYDKYITGFRVTGDWIYTGHRVYWMAKGKGIYSFLLGYSTELYGTDYWGIRLSAAPGVLFSPVRLTMEVSWEFGFK